MELDALYQELIRDHARRPRNTERPTDPYVEVEASNPTCGDSVALQLRVVGGVIEALRVQGEGCSISQASASMMAHRLEGRTLHEARAVADRFTGLVSGEGIAAPDRSLGELRAFGGVSRYPVRVRCALLAWSALREALSRAAPEAAG